MIELIENKEAKNSKNSFQLSIDGQIIPAKVRNFKKNDKSYININALNLNATEQISAFKFREFPNLYYLTMPLKIEGVEYLDRVYITRNDSTRQFEIKFRYRSDLKIWKSRENYLRFYGGYSRFIAELNFPSSRVIKDFKVINLKPEIKSLSHKTYGFEVSFVVLNFYEKLSDEINGYTNILNSYHKEVLRIIEMIDVFQVNEVDFNTIKAIFDFPDGIKSFCEQYLLYFAQFLRDLGINATSSLKEEAGKVLFSVTPTDDVEALDKIREALAVYLSFPSNPIPNSTGDRTVDMVLSGVRANVKHLESQLELAVAKLQFKEATLELKDATIEQHHLAMRQKDQTIKELKEIIARGNIFEESLERVEIDGELIDEASLYRFSCEGDIEAEAKPVLNENNEETRIGLVKFHEVTKLKDYGVTFDIPQVIRTLIDYFKKDKGD